MMTRDIIMSHTVAGEISKTSHPLNQLLRKTTKLECRIQVIISQQKSEEKKTTKLLYLILSFFIIDCAQAYET